MNTAGTGGEEVHIPRAAPDLNAPRVLVLNASYEPLHVTSAKRAITLLQYGVAEVLQNSAEVVRSPSTVLPIPSVIRLRRYVRRPRVHPVPFNRRNVLRRDTFTCQYCGERPPRSHLNLDHVVPRAHGGRSTWENVVASCLECNRRKGGRTPEQAGAIAAARRSGALPSRDEVLAQGNQLPDLRLDLHVYDPDPASRFVFLNMRKLREGETLPEGVRVDQITQTGVELTYRGRRFTLEGN